MDVDVAQLVGSWQIDPVHSAVEFTARHMMITKVTGRFTRFSGTFTVAPDTSSSTIEATILAGSISTHEPDRDDHLRSADFLHADAYPEITFRGRPKDAAGGRGLLTGDLTIRGVTRPVALDCTVEGYVPRDNNGQQRAALSASTAIDRTDFGLIWNRALETGGILVGNKVDIRLEIAATRTDAPN